jgi:hypothetical protein
VHPRDEKDHAEIERLLRISEEEEARALRNELIQFLQSDAAKREIATLIREPLESLVKGALRDPRLLEEIQTQLIASLTPTIKAGTARAAAAALQEVGDIQINTTWQTQLRMQAEQTLKKAFQEAEEAALQKLPAMVEGVRKDVQKKVEEAVRAAIPAAINNLPADWAAPIETGVGRAMNAAVSGTVQGIDTHVEVKSQTARSRKKLWSRIGLAAFVVAVIVFGLWRAYRGTDDNVGSDSAIVELSDTSTNTTAAPPPAPESPLVKEFEADLAENKRFTAKLKPQPVLQELTRPQLTCIRDSLAAADLEVEGVSVLTLSEYLHQCDALKAEPGDQEYFRLIGLLQMQFPRALSKCKDANTTITVDGEKGGQTNTALADYIRCNTKVGQGVPAGFPSEFKTLADYVTVSVILSHAHAHSREQRLR